LQLEKKGSRGRTGEKKKTWGGNVALEGEGKSDAERGEGHIGGKRQGVHENVRKGVKGEKKILKKKKKKKKKCPSSSTARKKRAPGFSELERGIFKTWGGGGG